jgi:dynactin 1
MKRLSLRPTPVKRSTDETASHASAASEASSELESPQEAGQYIPEDVPAHVKPAAKPSEIQRSTPARAGLSAASAPRSPQQNAAVARELEDMKTKLKVMEKKRAEDREKLKNLERLQSERDKYEGIIQKLQAKYQPQQIELTDLRKKLRDTETSLEEMERMQAEHESILEMAALDREMAEETAEAFKAESQTLKLRLEELELEVEVLRDENQELDQVMSPEEKSSQGWLQMEKTNERLREALIRLRDITQQQEAELRDQIKELQDDLEEYSTVKAKYEATKEKLLASESNVDELKQQLETALGAEEMIEELADKNMRYQEEINDLKAAIEDLESLKEINDELELNHIETEKQMQEEIDYREAIFNEQSRKVTHQDEVIEDLEYTLARFRDLVSNLQSDLEDMRASQQITESEANELTTRSRAMMNLNMKLQASVERAQTKTIDIELGRMEAEESAQHLSIVQLYLPEYFDGERNAILALLRAKRVGFKASLIHNTIREHLADQANFPMSQESAFTSYDIIEKSLWISCISERFIQFIASCSPEQFTGFERALYELEPVERTLNAWIEALKKNDVNEKKCAIELQRSIALLTHLAETLIPNELSTFADETNMRSLMIQTYLEDTASALSRLKNFLQTKLPLPAADDEDGLFFFNKTDSLISQARGLKVIITKVIRSLDDLRSRSLALSDEAAGPFESAEEVAKGLAEMARQLGENLAILLSEEGRTEPFTYPEIMTNMSQTTISLVQGSAPDAEDNDALSTLTTIFKTMAAHLEELNNHASDLSHTAEFERGHHPWIARSTELKSNKTISPDADEEIRRLKNELSEASTSLGVKDKTLEEQVMKVELLESRMRDANKKASVAKDFETKFDQMQQRETQLQESVGKLTKDLRTMETERDDYRARFEQAKRASGTAGAAITAGGVLVDSEASLAAMRENEVLRTEIGSLQAAVRFLREENRRANLLDPYSVQRSVNMYSWLDAPLTHAKRTPQQEAQLSRAAESRDVLTHLLKLTKESSVTDLASTLPQDTEKRLAWRPTKSTYKYQVLQHRERYERWTEWKDDVVTREREEERIIAAKKERAIRQQEARKQAQEKPAGACHGHTKSVGYGMMGRAWRILGMQGELDAKNQSEEPGQVQIVSSES